MVGIGARVQKMDASGLGDEPKHRVNVEYLGD
jgi:hypothetical protein